MSNRKTPTICAAFLLSVVVSVPSHAVTLTEAQLKAYAACREKLDAIAIRAILEAHASSSRPLALPVYGDHVIEWLLDEGRDLKKTVANATLERETVRCGIDGASGYWQMTRDIAAALGESTTNTALVGRYLETLGLCAPDGKLKQTADGAVVCWRGAAIQGGPCPADMNFGSTGYYERDGICYKPFGRPSGPRLRTTCSRPGEVRKDLPSYPVVCEEGTWTHARPCSKDGDCGRLALPTYCSRGVCYVRSDDKVYALRR